MQRTLGQDIPNRMERKMFLQDNCDAVEDLGYVKEIPSERLEELKEVLVENNIELRSLREAKKEAVKGFNEQIKPLEEINAQTTKQLKERSEYVNEQCYKFVDNEERTVGYYNSEGLLVFSRPIRPEEIQTTLNQAARAIGGY